VPNVLKLPGTSLLDGVVFFTAVDSAQEALTDMPPRAEEELDPVTLHNQALMNMEANPTQVQSDFKM